MIPRSIRTAGRLPRLRWFVSSVRWTIGLALRYPFRSDRRALVLAAGTAYWFLSDLAFFSVYTYVFTPAQQQSTVLIELVFNALSIPLLGYLLLVVQHGVHQRRALPRVGSWVGLLRRGTKVWAITAVLTVVGPSILAGWIFGPMTAVVLRLADAGVGSLARGVLEGSPFLLLVELLSLVVGWYIFPAAIVLFARRERLLDVIGISRYQQVLVDVDYDRLVVVPAFVFVFVTQIPFQVEFVAFSVAFEGGLVASPRTAIAVVVGLLASLVGFSLYLSMYYLMGFNWPRVGSASEDRRRAYRATKQLRLDEFERDRRER